MKYIKLFNTIVEYLSYMNGNPFLPNVSLVEESGGISYTPEKVIPEYENGYLYLEALEDGMTISFDKKATSGSLYYSLNKQDWNEVSGETPVVNSGEKVYFKGVDLVPKGWSIMDTLNVGIGTFAINKQCNVAGNVMSLLFADNFIGKTDLTGYDCAFYNLFKNCTTIPSAENLILPATTLAGRCYEGMFYGCTSLTTAPELPAPSVAYYCYCGMFNGCSSLTTAPLLPDTTLSTRCYYHMFKGCTSLTSAPELPATTLAEGCYSHMFQGCTGLTTAPELPATTLADECYYGMFHSCTNLTSAPELPATTLAEGCYEQMFSHCTSLTSAPVLPATTLADSCYYYMFYDTNVLPDCSNIDFSNSEVVTNGGLKGLFAGTKITDEDLFNILPVNENGKYYLPATTLGNSCYVQMFQSCTNLTTAPELPATALEYHCYYNMFAGCTNLTTAPELPATTLVANGCYEQMFDNCTSLTTAPELPATTLTASCYRNMFRGCTSLTTAPELPATTLAESCYLYMFDGCISLTTAPELPATTLTSSCYRSMFNECKKLNYIKMLATDISASDCLSNWVKNVSTTGTFVKADGVEIPSGYSGIPSGWTVQTA